MTRSGADPERLGVILRQLLDRLSVRERIRECTVLPYWEDAVGSTIAQHARPVRIRRGMLCVAVDSSVWMQELQFLKDSIRSQLNARVGSEIVADLFFVLDGAGGSR